MEQDDLCQRYQSPDTHVCCVNINIKVDFVAIIFGGINFYVYFCSGIRKRYGKKSVDRTIMKTNRIMDEIRSTISPEMKLQMEMSVAISNLIYEILEARGMSQKDFARLMGKTETEVSRWLSGTHNLTMATICKISAALDADVVKVADHELEPAYA